MKNHIPVVLENFEQRWILHPESNIDLAIMPMAPLLNKANQKGFHPFYIALDKSIIPTKEQLNELTAVEEILMTGYPIGIWDEVNNYPIFRKGITATHPYYDYNGRSEFVIDAACFPGSSGSPVFLANLGNYMEKKGGTVIGTRFYFLGVLYGGPQYTATGEVIVVDIPTQLDTIAVSNIPSNLGYVIKSKKILDFELILKSMVNRK